MKSKFRRAKSPITSKDILGISFSLEDVAGKIKNAAFFSEVLEKNRDRLHFCYNFC